MQDENASRKRAVVADRTAQQPPQRQKPENDL